MKKKILLGLTTAAAVVAPIATVVACGSSDDSVKYVKYTGGKIDKGHSYFVTDGGHLEDQSFNQSVWEGFKAGTGNQLKTNVLEPKTASEILNNYSNAKGKGAKLIVAAGFNHSTAITQFSQANPGIGFVWIDGVVNAKDGATEKPQGNIASIVYKMKEASFIAGVLAAKDAVKASKAPGGDKSANIGVYGGMDIPPVTDYIIGFKAGVEFWNTHHTDNKDQVEVKDGGFVGSFDPGGKSDSIAVSLANEGVELLMAVGGPQYKDALKAAKTKRNVKIIGVDTNIKNLLANHTDDQYVWGSILKNMKTTTEKVTSDILRDSTKHFGEIYTADLDDDGVGVVIGGTEYTKHDDFGLGDTTVSGQTVKQIIAAAKAVR